MSSTASTAPQSASTALTADHLEAAAKQLALVREFDRLSAATGRPASLLEGLASDERLVVAVQHELEAWAHLIRQDRDQAVEGWQAALASHERSASPLAQAQCELLTSETVGQSTGAPPPPAAFLERLGLPPANDPIWATVWRQGFGELGAGGPTMDAEPVPPADLQQSGPDADEQIPGDAELAPAPAELAPPAVAAPRPTTLDREIRCILPDGGTNTPFSLGTALPAEAMINLTAGHVLAPEGRPLILRLVEVEEPGSPSERSKTLGRVAIRATAKSGPIRMHVPILLVMQCAVDQSLSAAARPARAGGAALHATVETRAQPPDSVALARELAELRRRFQLLRAYARRTVAQVAPPPPMSQRQGTSAKGTLAVIDPAVAEARRAARAMFASAPADRILAGAKSPADRASGFAFLLELAAALDALDQALDRAGVDRSKVPPPPFPIATPERLLFQAEWFAGEGDFPPPVAPAASGEAGPMVVDKPAGKNDGRAKPAAEPPRRGFPPGDEASLPPPPKRRGFHWRAWPAAAVFLLILAFPYVRDDVRDWGSRASTWASGVHERFVTLFFQGNGGLSAEIPQPLDAPDTTAASEIFKAAGEEAAVDPEPGGTAILEVDQADAIVAPPRHEYAEAAFSPDRTRIVLAAKHGPALVWNLDGSGEAAVLPSRTGETFSSLAFHPDGAQVLTVSNLRPKNEAAIWRLEGTSWLVPTLAQEATLAAAISPDGRLVATAGWAGAIRVWRIAGQQGLAFSTRLAGGRNALGLTFSPDASKFAAIARDRTIRILSATDGSELAVLTGHDHLIQAVTFSNDGTRVATASRDGTARVWLAESSGAALALLAHDNEVVAASFSPDDEWVATGSVDGTARLWRANGQGLPVIFDGHGASVLAVAFSRDGEQLLTASTDGAVRIWSLDFLGEDRPKAAAIVVADTESHGAAEAAENRLVEALQPATVEVLDEREVSSTIGALPPLDLTDLPPSRQPGQIDREERGSEQAAEHTVGSGEPDAPIAVEPSAGPQQLVELGPPDMQPQIIPLGTMRSPYRSNENARAVQLILRQGGYYSGRIDGLFGGQSREALRQWKRGHGLAPDADWDNETERRMFGS